MGKMFVRKGEHRIPRTWVTALSHTVCELKTDCPPVAPAPPKPQSSRSKRFFSMRKITMVVSQAGRGIMEKSGKYKKFFIKLNEFKELSFTSWLCFVFLL